MSRKQFDANGVGLRVKRRLYFTDGEHFNSQSYNISGEENINQGFLKCKYFDQMIYTRGHLYLAKRHKWWLYKYPPLKSYKRNFKKLITRI